MKKTEDPMSFAKILNWYTNVMFESTFYSFLMLIFILMAIIYYARCKKNLIRWGCCPRYMSYEISV